MNIELIGENLRQSLYAEMQQEKLNSHIYLFVASWLKNKGLDSIASHFVEQYEEENKHFLQIVDLLTDLNAPVSIGEVDVADFEINSPMDIAKKYLDREIQTTESLCEIKQLAIDENNGIVEESIRKMIDQQRHEYAESTNFMDLCELSGNNWFNFSLLWNK